jgi:hypothetical protein
MSTLAGLFPKGRWPNAAGLPAALSRGLRTAALRLSFAIVTKSGATLDRASWDFVLNLVKRFVFPLAHATSAMRIPPAFA